jgi:hypothetical protein
MAIPMPPSHPSPDGAEYESVEPDLFPEIAASKKRAFLLAYLTCGRTLTAAVLAGISERSHYYWLVKDEAYVTAFKRAQTLAAHLLEDEIWRRGRDGVEVPIYHQGVQVGTRKEYSDTLLIFAAKGAMPDKYRESSRVEHSLSPALMALHASWQEAAAFQTPDGPVVEGEYQPYPSPFGCTRSCPWRRI